MCDKVGAFTGGKNEYFGVLKRATQEQYRLAHALLLIKPQIVEEFVRYLLSGERASFVKQDARFWNTNFNDIEMSISLLNKLKKDISGVISCPLLNGILDLRFMVY